MYQCAEQHQAGYHDNDIERLIREILDRHGESIWCLQRNYGEDCEHSDRIVERHHEAHKQAKGCYVPLILMMLREPRSATSSVHAHTVASPITADHYKGEWGL